MKRMTVARGGKRGKTAGRGGKGQSARAGNKRRPEWRDIIKKLPKLRGRGVNSNKPVALVTKLAIVNLSAIESVFGANESVTPATLVEKGLVVSRSGRMPAVKILGDGEATKAIQVSGCYFSGSAKEKIEKAGGSVKPLEVVKMVKVVKPQRQVASEGKTVAAEKSPKVAKAPAPAKKEKAAKKEVKEVKKS